MKSKVFFSSEITAEKVVELFHAAANDLPGGILPGKVAVKLHSGEPGNQNFLKPEFWQPIVNDVHGTVVEPLSQVFFVLYYRAVLRFHLFHRL